MQEPSDIDDDYSIPPQHQGMFWAFFKMLYFCFAVISALFFMLTSFKTALQLTGGLLIMFVGPLTWALYRDLYAVKPDLFQQRSQRYEEFHEAQSHRVWLRYHGYFEARLLAPTAAAVFYGLGCVTIMTLSLVGPDC